MKRIITNLIVFIMLGVIFPLQVNANTISTSISGVSQISSTQNIVITYSFNSSSSLGGIQGVITKDNKLSYVSHDFLISGGPLNYNSSTGAFNMNFTDAQSGSKSFLRVTYKPTSNFVVNSSTKLSLGSFIASNPTGDIRYEGTPSSKSITYVAPKSTNNNLSALTVGGHSVPSFSASKTTYNLGSTDSSSVSVGATAADSKARITGTGTTNLSYGANSIRVIVTAESGAKKTYTISISRNDPRSSNNFLESITMSEGSIQFDKNRDSYTVIVDYELEELTISATKEDASASLKNASITKQLEVYSNIFEFVVVAENNQQRTYTINVVRRDEDGYAGSLNTNNNLATLAIEGYEIDFDSEKLEYQLQVEHPVKALNITASVEDDKSTLVSVDSFELVLGENIFEFVVIAEDETQKKYTLTVFRATNLPPLEINELIERLDEVEADVLNVITSANNQFDANLLNQLKATNKQVAFHILNQDGNSIGYWLMDSENLESINNFNHGVTLLSRIPESISNALNYANAMVVSFDHDGEFDQPKTFVLYLNNTFDKSYPLNVYYFNEETSKLQLVDDALTQQDNTLTWQMDHASIYVITPATLSTGFDLGFDLPFEINLPIILGILIVLVLSLFGNLLLLLKVKKLQKHLIKRKYEALKPKEQPKVTTTQKGESVNQESVKDNKET